MRKTDGNLSPNIPATVLVYMALVILMIVFLLPKLQGKGMLEVFFYGALFGLMLYGFYDFTNYALFQNWTLKVTIVDILWGGLFCGLGSIILVSLNKFFS